MLRNLVDKLECEGNEIFVFYYALGPRVKCYLVLKTPQSRSVNLLLKFELHVYV